MLTHPGSGTGGLRYSQAPGVRFPGEYQERKRRLLTDFLRPGLVPHRVPQIPSGANTGISGVSEKAVFDQRLQRVEVVPQRVPAWVLLTRCAGISRVKFRQSKTRSKMFSPRWSSKDNDFAGGPKR